MPFIVVAAAAIAVGRHITTYVSYINTRDMTTRPRRRVRFSKFWVFFFFFWPFLTRFRLTHLLRYNIYIIAIVFAANQICDIIYDIDEEIAHYVIKFGTNLNSMFQRGKGISKDLSNGNTLYGI